MSKKEQVKVEALVYDKNKDQFVKKEKVFKKRDKHRRG
jgi:hypothetical protein